MEEMTAASLLVVAVALATATCTLVSGCLKRNNKKKKQPKPGGSQKSKDDPKQAKEKKGSQITPAPKKWIGADPNSLSAGHTPLSRNFHSNEYPWPHGEPYNQHTSIQSVRAPVAPPPMAQQNRGKSGVDPAIVGRSGPKTEPELRPTFKTIKNEEEFEVCTSPTQSDSHEHLLTNPSD